MVKNGFILVARGVTKDCLYETLLQCTLFIVITHTLALHGFGVFTRMVKLELGSIGRSRIASYIPISLAHA